MDYAKKIQELKIILPEPPKPVGSYRPVILAGGIAFLSGQVSKSLEGRLITGKLGADLDVEAGKRAARAAALNAVSIISHFIGFEKFERLLRLVGYVQASPSFYEIPQVVNGASDLFIEIFGDEGAHARSAVGMASLPLNAAVEIEVTLKVRYA